MAATTNPPVPKKGEESGRFIPLVVRRFVRNRLAVVSLVFLVFLVFGTVFAPYLTPYEPDTLNMRERFQGPSADYWLGTDENGRDILTRLLYGSRVSLTVGIMAMALALTVGVMLGGVSALLGGFVDNALMRVTDAMLAIPTFFLALMTMAAYGPSVTNLILVIGLTGWMTVARVVRAESLRVMQLEYVTAVRALGAQQLRILAVHLIPQTVPSIIVAASLAVPRAIVVESALSYLGLGVQPPMPSWGNMLSSAQNYIWQAPAMSVFPGLLILLTVLAFNLLGDGLRDALDPRLKGK